MSRDIDVFGYWFRKINAIYSSARKDDVLVVPLLVAEVVDDLTIFGDVLVHFLIS